MGLRPRRRPSFVWVCVRGPRVVAGQYNTDLGASARRGSANGGGAFGAKNEGGEGGAEGRIPGAGQITGFSPAQAFA